MTAPASHGTLPTPLALFIETTTSEPHVTGLCWQGWLPKPTFAALHTQLDATISQPN